MAMFVHLTSSKYEKDILRGGIKSTNVGEAINRGVFAVPVIPNFYISHQWLRELKAYGQKTIIGVYFRIPDSEPVYISHYLSKKRRYTASEAAGLIHNLDEAEGYEVLIPRKIEKNEIHKIRMLPQVTGWRYQPNSHKKHYCGCPICVRPGTVRSNVKNQKWEAEN